jgi:hypothetical protein
MRSISEYRRTEFMDDVEGAMFGDKLPSEPHAAKATILLENGDVAHYYWQECNAPAGSHMETVMGSEVLWCETQLSDELSGKEIFELIAESYHNLQSRDFVESGSIEDGDSDGD